MQDNETKRYNLQMPPDLWERLRDVADERSESIAETIRTFIRFGLMAVNEERDGGRVQIVTSNGDLMRVILL